MQTPTISMIVDKANERANFVKQKYYTVDIDCGNFTAVSKRIDDIEVAKAITAHCNVAVVASVLQTEKSQHPPKLYDLTTLQRDANRLYGYTAQQTLESVQRLYDNKLATYPRTDSRYLTEDMGDTANAVINSIISVFDFAKNIDFEPDIQAVMNNRKVSDHHAIIPTVNIKAADLSKLTTTDNKILTLISSRLLSATNSDYVYDSTKITLKCGNTEFTATGTTVISLGFKEIENSFKKSTGIKSENKEDNSLPQLTEGESFTVFAKISEHFTAPTALYTEDTLLSAMENAGSSDYNTDDVERKG